ncbi:MAG: hypothetical protein Q9201_003852 [Fulgogasparrea decipioides]
MASDLNGRFLIRAGDDVRWTGWTAGDGAKDGKDADGIWSVKDVIGEVTKNEPVPNNRTFGFWAGGVSEGDDFDNIYEFIESKTDNVGKVFKDVFSFDALQKMGLSSQNRNGLWWRAINRASKGLAVAAYGGTAYIYMNNNNCRHIFSPPSKNPQDSDPDHGGQATNGEIWYYAELPTLMRNLNINKIITFYKTKREPGKPPRFVQNVAWDVDRAGDKPRNFLEDIAMDASPIILPPEAGRPPLKRNLIARDGAPAIEYQEGLFDVKMVLAPSLKSDSATPLSVGLDEKVTHISLPTMASISLGQTFENGWGATYRFQKPSGAGELFHSVERQGAQFVDHCPSGKARWDLLSSPDSLLLDHESLCLGSLKAGKPNAAFSNSKHNGKPSSPTTVEPISGDSAQTSTHGGNTGPPSQGSGIGLSSRGGTTATSAQGSNTISSSQVSSIHPSSHDETTESTTQGGNTSVSSLGSSVGTASWGSSNGTPAQSSGAESEPRASSMGAPSQRNTNMESQTNAGAPLSSSLNSPSPSQKSGSGSSLGASSNTRNTNSRATPSRVTSSISGAGISNLGAVTPPFTSKGPNPTDGQPNPPTTAAPILATGTEAKSSASSLSSQIVIIAPVWQDFIDRPDKDKGDDLINKIKDLEDYAEDFEIRIGPPPSGTDSDCSVSTNLIKDIFNAVKCVTDNLKKAEDDIEAAIKSNFDDLSIVRTRLENVKGLEDSLKEDQEDDDDNSSSKKHDESSRSSGRPSPQPTSPTPSVTDKITTVSTAISAAACPLRDASAVPAKPQPNGPFVTAWFDYGVYCAGSNCGAFDSGSPASATDGASGPSLASFTASSKSVTGSSVLPATKPAIGTGNTAPTPAKSTSNRRAGTYTGTLFGSGSSNTVSTTFGGSNPSVATFVSSKTSAAHAKLSTLSCASPSSVPTSVPQSDVQRDIQAWCSGELNLFKPSTSCDNVDRDGFWLSNKCTPKTNPYFQQFYFPGTTMYFNASLVQGTEEYLANSTTCESALEEVLNGCPPSSGDPLVKYGGGVVRDDGTGKKALWQILLMPVEAIS